jgi:hypothetical protein
MFRNPFVVEFVQEIIAYRQEVLIIDIMKLVVVRPFCDGI